MLVAFCINGMNLRVAIMGDILLSLLWGGLNNAMFVLNSTDELWLLLNPLGLAG